MSKPHKPWRHAALEIWPRSVRGGARAFAVCINIPKIFFLHFYLIQMKGLSWSRQFIKYSHQTTPRWSKDIHSDVILENCMII